MTLPEPMFTDVPQDHLDVSESECVRRHAATFRSVRERLLSEREAADELTRAWSDAGGDGLAGDERERVRPHAVAVTGNALPSVAGRFAGKARGAGWAVTAIAARGRRGGDGPWVDSVQVRAAREGERVVGYWRTEPVVFPFKVRWKFIAGLAWSERRGTRSVGARELVALLDQADTLECNHDIVRGEGGPDGEDRS